MAEDQVSESDLGALGDLEPIKRRELFFAIVCPLGIDKTPVHSALRESLSTAGYKLHAVKISNALSAKDVPEKRLERKSALMDAGDRLRKAWDDRVTSVQPEHRFKGEAAALLAVTLISKKRGELLKVTDRQNLKPIPETAYLIDSLKHPDELAVLRYIYGSAFYAIGLYLPEEQRLENLCKETEHRNDEMARELLERDKHSGNPLGQQIEEAFHRCDFIIDMSRRQSRISDQIDRFVRLVFGDPLKTPDRDEVAMFQATAAQARSGSLGRQVGAAIVRRDGSIVAVGTNEVAKPIKGGQYWAKDDHKYRGRDMIYSSRDTSDKYRRDSVINLLRLLANAKGLDDFGIHVEIKAGLWNDEKKLDQLIVEGSAPLKAALIRESMDRIRAVHAETAALIDAARHGTPVLGQTMYVTDFPCHECARHIVASGIKKVVYLAPYPKSAAAELYEDSIQIDCLDKSEKKVMFRSFVGIAPRRYLDFFSVDARSRKTKAGKLKKLAISEAEPYLPDNPIPAHLVPLNEFGNTDLFTTFLNEEWSTH